MSDLRDIESLITDSEDGTPRRSYSISSRYETMSSGSHTAYPSLLSSAFNTHTVDDTAISGDDYVYRGDPRALNGAGTRRRLSTRLRRSGSMTDMDTEFAHNRSSGSYRTPNEGSEDGSDLSYSRFTSTQNQTPSYTYTSGITSSPYTRTSAYSSSPYTRTSASTSSPYTYTSETYSGTRTDSASMLGDSHGGYSGIIFHW